MIHTTSFYINSSNKKHTLFVKQWRNQEKPIKAIFQIVHGMIEHIGRYEEFAEYMAGKGFLVIGHDHIAHGQSVIHNEELGIMYPNDWFAMVEDVYQLSKIMQQQYPNIPYFLLGHSMGSFVVRTYISKYDTAYLNGVLVSGTAWHSHLECQFGIFLTSTLSLLQGINHRNKLVYQLTLGQYKKPFKPCTTPVDWLSKNTSYNENFMNDDKCRFIFSLGAYRELFRGLAYLADKKHLQDIRHSLPLYFFSGDHDPVGNFGKGVLHVVNNLQQAGIKNITLKMYPNGRHEMLHEINRQEVFNNIHKWIDTYL